MNNIIYILIFIAPMLVSCASVGPALEQTFISMQAEGIEGESFVRVAPDNIETSTVYVYRLPDAAFGIRSPLITLDHYEIGDISNGGYFTIVISPGSHVLESEGGILVGSADLEFNAEGGKEYFISYKIGTFSSHLDILNPEEALQQIEKTKMQKSVKLMMK